MVGNRTAAKDSHMVEVGDTSCEQLEKRLLVAVDRDSNTGQEDSLDIAWVRPTVAQARLASLLLA